MQGEEQYPKCGRCGMQVNPTATGHQAMKTCKAMHAARLQRKAVSDSSVALDVKFYAYGEVWNGWRFSNISGTSSPLMIMTLRRYAGTLWRPAASWVWARISRVLRADSASTLRLWHVLQCHRAVCPYFQERDMGSVTRYAATFGGLPCEGGPTYDRLAPQEGRGILSVPQDKNCTSGGRLAHN